MVLGVGRNRLRGNLSTVVDILGIGDHKARAGGNQRVQIDHLTVVVEESVMHAGAGERVADNLPAVVDSRRICPRPSKRAQVGQMTVAIEKRMRGAAGGGRCADGSRCATECLYSASALSLPHRQHHTRRPHTNMIIRNVESPKL
jgi:hypothetical protein